MIPLAVALRKVTDLRSLRAKNATRDSYMLTASVLLIVTLVAQADTGSAEPSPSHYYYAARLIGALLIATFVPLLIDRRARRVTRR